MDLTNKGLEHLFRDIEVCNDAVLQWSDSRDVAGCAPEHQLGVVTDRRYRSGATRPALVAHRHHGRLIQNNPLRTAVYQRVCSSQIDRQIV